MAVFTRKDGKWRLRGVFGKVKGLRKENVGRKMSKSMSKLKILASLDNPGDDFHLFSPSLRPKLFCFDFGVYFSVKS